MTGRGRDLSPFFFKAGCAFLISLAGFFAAHRRRSSRPISPSLPLSPHLFSDAAPDDSELSIHRRNGETLAKEHRFASSDGFESKDSAGMAEEVKRLRELVRSLEEREACLEMQLLEYHGLKEHEVSVRELQNRLKISATEIKLLSLRIDSLKVENEKLRRILFLERKLESIDEQGVEKAAANHENNAELREAEQMQKLNKLKIELIELPIENSTLEQENLAVVKKFDSEHFLKPSELGSSSSAVKSQELIILEDPNQLREENENLKKKMEQLQTDHFEYVEELVYLRWVNACLRYELRNFQPSPGRAVARDLSFCLSPSSEQKAKELILEYSKSCFDLNSSRLNDFQVDDSFSQESDEESDEISLDSSKSKFSKLSKSNFFDKFKKLVLVKGCKDMNFERKTSVSSCRKKSVGYTSGFSVERSISSTGKEFYDNEKWRIKRNSSHGSLRCSSDLGVTFADNKKFPSKEYVSVSNSTSSVVNDEGDGNPVKDRLKKFAQVFKSSHY